MIKKRCPYCNGEGELKTRSECAGHGDYYENAYVQCKKCFATGPQIDNYYSHRNKESIEEIKKEAIKRWEER